MCAHGQTGIVKVGDREIPIDACIAPIVRALNEGGVETAMSCCGHGEGDGFIMLADGRILAIRPVGAFAAEGFQAMAERFDNLRIRGGR